MTSQKADDALRYYKGCKGKTIEEADSLLTELERLKAISDKQTNDEKVTFSDFCKPNTSFDSAWSTI